MVKCRGIRGATSVPGNSETEILRATRALLEKMIEENEVPVDAIAGAIFTATPDLNAVHPAQAARDLGWIQTPLLCAQDIDVPGSVPRCVRVLMLANVDRAVDRIRHVYLGDARSLRPDWAKEV
jgi:chorismate mutase